MSTTAESICVVISILERDVAWLERWLSGDRTRNGLKQFYGPQPWIDETDHWKLVSDARDTVHVNRKYLERLRGELAAIRLAA
ncbi:MAG: hypothetical protein ABI317_03900 [Gaiellales bacterium]